MAWSIFDQGGGAGAAVTWADDLLDAIGAPKDPGTVQFVYDWERSEGGGGLYNPLNQGPVPNQPGLTSTGPQYGGGAADYVSWQAGLTGAVDYLNMPNFVAVRDALRRDDPVAARAALIASPWAAGHYGGGRGFSTAPVPGKQSALANFQGSMNPDGSVTAVPTQATLTGFSLGGIVDDIGGVFGGLIKGVAGDVSAVGRIASTLAGFFSALLAGSTWIRLGEAVLGVWFISGGIALLVIVLASSSGGQSAIGSIASMIPGEGQAARLGAKVASSAGTRSARTYATRTRSQAATATARASRTRAKTKQVRAATAHTRARTAAAAASRNRTRRPDRDDRRAETAGASSRSNRAAYRRHMDTSDLRRRTP